jgi:FAD-linked sulfhydryl oxidase
MLSRFPLKPTPSDREALKTFIHLFARLYPCGECGQHFTELLKKYPPQTSSREAASMWGCAVHNRVNERLGKEQFDCKGVVDKYKCGCDDAEEEDKKALEAEGGVIDAGVKDTLKGREGRVEEEPRRNILDEFGPLIGEGMSKGG